MTPTKREIVERQLMEQEALVYAQRLAFILEGEGEGGATTLPEPVQEALKDLRYSLNTAWPADTAAAHRRAVGRWRDKNVDKVRQQNREAQRRRYERLRGAREYRRPVFGYALDEQGRTVVILHGGLTGDRITLDHDTPQARKAARATLTSQLAERVARLRP